MWRGPDDFISRGPASPDFYSLPPKLDPGRNAHVTAVAASLRPGVHVQDMGQDLQKCLTGDLLRLLPKSPQTLNLIFTFWALALRMLKIISKNCMSSWRGTWPKLMTWKIGLEGFILGSEVFQRLSLTYQKQCTP